MAKKKKASSPRGKLGIVCAWRKGETDLSATLESAGASATKTSRIYAVEDTDAQGPARTRHRGIDAAADCDVIAIIDSHMRFRGKMLAALARHVRTSGALACATVYHNGNCSFAGGAYHGGRIVYRAKDGKQKNALAVKWSRESTPGARGAVIGACYVFPRAWYYKAGQPLAALPGWGCDEEALSISAWMSGIAVECLPHECAHLYRDRAPWTVTRAEHANAHASRMALIHAVASEINARRELESWQRSWVPEGVPPCTSAEGERWRKALLKMPRKWRDWLREVCEPDEIDGTQAENAEEKNAKRRPIQNPTSNIHGAKCPHCQAIHDPKKLKVTHTYANGNRRHKCPICENNFISMFHATE